MRKLLMLVASAGCGRVGYSAASMASDADVASDADAAGGPAITSCTALAPTCGLSATASCCDSPLVLGGTFARSYDLGADAMFPDSSFEATISEFRLDAFEVTVGRFRAFVTSGEGTQMSPPASGEGAHPNILGTGWDASWNGDLAADTSELATRLKCLANRETWTDTPGANENRPIVCVNWYEAFAFCAWDNGFLPTEAEWNYAAAGGDQQRAYPWSSPPESLAIDDTHASWSCMGDGALGCLPADLVAVGTFPAGNGRWGQSDLAGNASEYTLDWKQATYQNPCVDCVETDESQSVMVVRGGSWGDSAFNMRGAHRGSVSPPIVRQVDRGLRCARSP